MRSYHRSTRITLSALAGIALAASTLFSGRVQASGTHARLHASSTTICFLVKTLTNPYFVAMKPVAQATATRLGVKLLYEAGKYDGDNATQTAQVDDCVTRKAGAIVLIPELSAGIVPAVRRATAAHIAVLALDTATIPASAVTSFVATNNFLAGVKNGQWAKRAMGSTKPVVALLEGTPGSSVNTDRMGGFLQGFGSGRKYVVSDLVTSGDQAKAQTAMENALTAHPTINLVWTINEPAALGAAVAIKSHGMAGKVKIVSMDGGCRGIKAVQSGTIDTDVMQFPRKMAQLGVQYGSQASQGKHIPARVDTGEPLITKNPHGLAHKSIKFALANCWG
ncbi:MAG TPA: substrate-binding domain-containing protein [Chloroflexota bacterium]